MNRRQVIGWSLLFAFTLVSGWHLIGQVFDHPHAELSRIQAQEIKTTWISAQPPRTESANAFDSGTSSLPPRFGRKVARRIYSENPLYPALSRLHAERSPGSWASAMQLLRACSAAQFYLDTGSGASLIAGDASIEARQLAKQKLEARCLDKQIEVYVQQFLEVRADDVFGTRYLAAMEDIRQLRSGATIKSALEELARQGKLGDAAAVPKFFALWDGTPWPGGASEFARLVDAAVERATSEDGYERDDLRLLLKCYSKGDCSYKYGPLPSDVPPQRQQQAEALVSAMSEAIRSGNVEVLLGTKR